MIDFKKPKTDAEFQYVQKILMTYTLTQLWQTREKYSARNWWIGMVEFDETPHRCPNWAERTEKLFRIIEICNQFRDPIKFGAIGTWSWNKFIVSHLGSAPKKLPLKIKNIISFFDGQSQILKGATPYKVRTIQFNPEFSVSDHIEILSTQAALDCKYVKCEIPNHTNSVPLKIATSYSQYYLVNLVAKNRNESVESVIREGISILLATLSRC